VLETAQLIQRESRSVSSGPPGSTPCSSLHRSVGNLRRTEPIHPRFPMLISPVRPARRRFSGDFPAKLPDTRVFSHGRPVLAGLRPPPSSPDKQRWFPELRKSTLFQWLGGTKRSLRSRFLSFAPAERLERPSVSSDKNSVSQSADAVVGKVTGTRPEHSDIAILVRGGRDFWTVNQI
jgi:hypothetical protein